VTTQADFLRRYGIERLVEEGKRVWRDNAPHPDLATMKMRSRVNEAEALLDRSGLGGFSVLEWRTPGIVR
jgi:SAM-dependent MidA family methyltransferase